ncbi:MULTISPECIES: permease-like cell division protein FtsX [unclassified Massilia]|uniref:permease-like cell division protein FtsX n=1 Tax=unclassified Massilia TaxID=2609279 RepID=UPI0017817E51|nr:MULTISPECIES: permease-like cell division protein FtsX [unclassified Massilia]MBD8529195.1 ABC transporter permease [Massilia sp. CFBP 13647]MBD8672589.1 ABC transporter permease [Massilia sp. CFBP 13721]
MSPWFREHRFALGSALTTLRKAPGSFLFNVLVVAVALALPFAGITLLDNVRPMSEQLSVDPEVSLFMRPDAPREEALALEPQLRQILQGSHAQISFVPREQALDDLKERSGLSAALDTLGDNPLPDSYVMKLDGFSSARDAARIDNIVEQMGALPQVDTVQVDSAWVKRLAALLGILRLALLLLAITLGVVVIAVVFNTIRLQVLTQREEIAVSKLLGATDNFIHRPFYYTGALLGLCAGAVALGAVTLALNPLNAAIAEFARLYASEFQLAPLGVLEVAGLLAISAGLGLIGALLSVQRHLARMR